MNWSDTISPAIVDILNSAEGMGKTYPSERSSQFITTHKSLFVTDAGVFHVWWPTLLGWTAEGSRQHQIERQYNIELVGYYSLENESESRQLFETVVLNVANKFDSDANYGLGGLIQFQTPTTAEISAEAVQYGGVTCHRAAVRFTISESVISE